MTTIDPRLERAITLRTEERYGEALSLLQEVLAEIELAGEPTRSDYFLPLLEWYALVPLHAPALTALDRARDEHAKRLLAGDLYCGRDATQDSKADTFHRVSRFSLIAEMNETLLDTGATHALFMKLEARRPELARRYAWRALPAMVEAGDFELADRYRGDPLALMDEVNRLARSMPLLPLSRKAPRLWADLSNLVKEVHIGAAVLRGLGRQAEAVALRPALLAGLEDEAVRDLARRALDEPSLVLRELVQHQMAQDDAAAAGQPE